MILPGRVGRELTAGELAARLNVVTPVDESPGQQPSAVGAHATTVLCLGVLVWEWTGLDVHHLTTNDMAVGTALMVVLLALALGAQWQHRLAVRDYWDRCHRIADRRAAHHAAVRTEPSPAEPVVDQALGASGALPHPIALRRYLSVVPDDDTEAAVPITALRAHVRRAR